MKKNHKGSKGNNNHINVLGKIEITKHVIDRAILRRNIDINVMNEGQINALRNEMKETITNQVRQSTLIKIVNNEEHRLHRGFIFVIKREYSIAGENIKVITMKLSKVQQKRNFSSDFSMETVDKKAMDADYNKVRHA